MSRENGHKDGAEVALRGSAGDLSSRQRAILEQLATSFEGREALAQWADEAMEAAAGRMNDGLRCLLGGHELAWKVLEPYYLAAEKGDTPEGREWRRRMHRTLRMAYGQPLREIVLRDAPDDTDEDRNPPSRATHTTLEDET